MVIAYFKLFLFVSCSFHSPRGKSVFCCLPKDFWIARCCQTHNYFNLWYNLTETNLSPDHAVSVKTQFLSPIYPNWLTHTHTYTHVYLLDVPLSLGRDDVVSSVLCCLHTDAADTVVVSMTEELQTSQVNGTQRQIGGRVTGTPQRVPVITLKQSCCQLCCYHHYYSNTTVIQPCTFSTWQLLCLHLWLHEYSVQWLYLRFLMWKQLPVAAGNKPDESGKTSPKQESYEH